jgi:hypothetical protein
MTYVHIHHQAYIDAVAAALGPDVGPEFAASDWYDLWGTAMGWSFAINDMLVDCGGTTNPTFRQSTMGSDTEAYEYQALDHAQVPVLRLEVAERILDQLIDVLTNEGYSY